MIKTVIRNLIGCGDYDDLKRQNAELYKLAHFDSLTGLANRRQLDATINLMHTHCLTVGKTFTVFLIDLDNFKYINDTHGHMSGNAVLQIISTRLTRIANARNSLTFCNECIRNMSTNCCNSIVARIGGDEFAMVFEDMDKYESAITAQQIKQEIRKPIKIDQYEVIASVSIGISMYPDNGSSVEDIIKTADVAMYETKESGKNGYKLYNSSMSTKIERFAETELMVRKLINNENVTLFYQPIICAQTGNIVGVEALLRGSKTAEKFYDPAEIIEVAENTNLIIPLGSTILEHSCKFARQYVDLVGDQYDPFVSVNVSLAQLLDPDFVDLVRANLKNYSLQPSSLIIELTESMLMQDYDVSSDTLRKLKKLGVRISIDDFGKGYSSFSYLQNLPIDKIKIDMSFVQSMGNDNKANEIVKGIILMADTLGMATCAEGVETQFQFDNLKKYGCKQIQGFYTYRPLNEQDLVSIITPKNTEA
jgi:predicted signal transduction protein with EAL and GGDEF domain